MIKQYQCFLLIFIAILISSCVRVTQAINVSNVNKLAIGMSKDEVKDIAGRPNIVNTDLNANGDILLIYYYYTDKKRGDGIATPDECTPVVFKDDIVIGIGQDYLLIEKAKAKKERRGSGGKEEDSICFGTAWPTPNGYIVTSYHVVKGHSNIYIIDKREKIPVQLEFKDVYNDIALLRTKGDKSLPKALPLCEERVKLGSEVFTIGYPHPDIMGSSPKLTYGTISSLAGAQDDPRFYQITVPVQSGNSGGPLFNMTGEVIGMITSKIDAVELYKWTGDLPQNVNYAIKIAYIQPLLDTADSKYPCAGVHDSAGGSLENLARRVKDSIFIIVAE